MTVYVCVLLLQSDILQNNWKWGFGQNLSYIMGFIYRLLDTLVLASSAGGPGFNPVSRRYKNGTSSCLALNIEKGNTGSFSRTRIRK